VRSSDAYVFCKLILTKPNILIFDEPTNHLGLEAINALNIALQRFEGIILLVTHDHDLIDEVATRLWNFTPTGIEDFQGPLLGVEGKAQLTFIAGLLLLAEEPQVIRAI
jgi:ATPase subunit of ABC transporter with duplicated ATPase domains